MNDESGGSGRGSFACLVDEIGRAATAGWAQTARLGILLVIAAVAIALIMVVYQ